MVRAHAWILMAVLVGTAAAPGVLLAEDVRTRAGQDTLDLNTPPSDFVGKGRDDTAAYGNNIPEPKKAPSSMSLSVTGSVAAQVTVTNPGQSGK